MPADRDVTTPVPAPIVATEGVALVHAPPGVVQERVVLLPLHTVNVPVIGATAVGALTVTIVVAAPVPQAFVRL